MRTQSNTVSSKSASQVKFRSFQLGAFHFARDAYFAWIVWPQAVQPIEIGRFLDVLTRTLERQFSYGWVFFDDTDDTFGTVNLYGEVELFAGQSYACQRAGLAYTETLPIEQVQNVFLEIARDWADEGMANKLHFMDARGQAELALPLLGQSIELEPSLATTNPSGRTLASMLEIAETTAAAAIERARRSSSSSTVYPRLPRPSH